MDFRGRFELGFTGNRFNIARRQQLTPSQGIAEQPTRDAEPRPAYLLTGL
jgi:hypothetical protein